VVHLVEDQPPDGGHVPRRRRLARRAACPGQHDLGAPPVAGAVPPDDEPAADHAGQHVRKPALLPVQGEAELERAEHAFWRLAELHEHLVFRQREPGIGLQLPVQAGGQQRPHAQVGAPGALLVRGEPLGGHGLMVPGINDVSSTLTSHMTRHPNAKVASTSVPVHPLLAERWSPRGFDRSHELGDEALTALLEAARWAPSSRNSQPWRFLVTRRGEEAHDRLFAALAPGNRAWAGAASALVLVAARTVGDNGRPQRFALYDTGGAVAALVTQAQADGLAVCQIGGFDSAAARAEFGLDDTLTPVVVLAIGRHSTADLPEPLAAHDAAPRIRRPLGDLLLPTRPELELAAA
jgi:nitroreductase